MKHASNLFISIWKSPCLFVEKHRDYGKLTSYYQNIKIKYHEGNPIYMLKI